MEVLQEEEDTKKDLIQEEGDRGLKEGVTNGQPEEDVRNYKVIVHITYIHIYQYVLW